MLDLTCRVIRSTANPLHQFFFSDLPDNCVRVLSLILDIVADCLRVTMKQFSTPSAVKAPLCIDLDGTLSRTDTLHEGVLRALKGSPLELLRALPLALRCKAGFKRRIAEIAPTPADTLPLNGDLVD